MHEGLNMNISIYLEDELSKKVRAQAKLLGKSRNAIIREAISEWLARRKTKHWPAAVLNFKGDPDFPRFESYRSELLPPKEDPFE